MRPASAASPNAAVSLAARAGSSERASAAESSPAPRSELLVPIATPRPSHGPAGKPASASAIAAAQTANRVLRSQTLSAFVTRK